MPGGATADLACCDRTSAADSCGFGPDAEGVRRMLSQWMNQRWCGVTFLAAGLRIVRSTWRALGSLHGTVDNVWLIDVCWSRERR